MLPTTMLAILLSVLLALLPRAAWSLDEGRLWLPAKYRVHYIALRDAARAVEAGERCTEVLRGTLDLDVSTPQQPYFRILCRQASGQTYSELIDGITLLPKSALDNTPPPETPRERETRLAREAAAAENERLVAEQARIIAEQAHIIAEQERLLAEERARRELEREALAMEQARMAEAKARAEAEEQARAEAEELERLAAEAERDKAARAEQAAARKLRDLARRRQVLSEVCRSEILARTSMMMNLQWLTDQPVPEELENGQMRFYAQFDAENMWGRKLHYEAVCTISTPTELVVIVSAR